MKTFLRDVAVVTLGVAAGSLIYAIAATLINLAIMLLAPSVPY